MTDQERPLPCRRRVLPAALIALAVLAAAGPAQTGGPSAGKLTLESIAPEDVFAFFSFAGLENASRAAEKLGLFQLWREPEVQAFLDKLTGRYEELAADTPPAVLASWKATKPLFAGRISAIVGGLTVIWTRDAPIPVCPGVVIALDLGDRRDAFRARLERWLASDDFKREVRGVVRSTESYHGHEILVFRRVRGWPRASLCATFLDNLFLVGLNRPLLQKCLDNHAGGGGRSLARLPAFCRSRSKGAPGPLVEAFLHVDGITRRLRGLVADEWRGVLHDLGLDGIHAVYYASAVSDGESLDTVYVDAPHPRRGLLNACAGTLDPGSLKRIPATAAWFQAFRLDLGALYDIAWNVLAQVAPPREVQLARRDLERTEAALGFKIRDGLLAALGHEWVFYAELPRNGLVPNVVAVLDVADRAKAEAVLHALLDLGRIKAREVPFGNHRLTVIRLPGKVPFSPAYALVGGKLLIALTPAGLKRAIRHLERPKGSVVDSPGFQATFKTLDWRKAAAISYLDVKRLAAFGYNLAESFLPGLIDDEDIPVDLARLPSEDVVLSHLTGWGDLAFGDQDGIVYQGRFFSAASFLALTSRFLDRAPGVPPRVLGRLIYRMMRPQIRFGSTRRRGRAVSIARPVPSLEPGPLAASGLVGSLARLNTLLAEKPDSGRLLFTRGQVLYRLRRFAESAGDFQQAHSRHYRRAVAAYNAARCLALARKTDAALKWLEMAFRNGFEDWALLRGDRDLSPLRNDPRFKALVRKYRGL